MKYMIEKVLEQGDNVMFGKQSNDLLIGVDKFLYVIEEVVLNVQIVVGSVYYRA